MGHLHEQVDFTTTRLVDFALGLVDTHEGRLTHAGYNKAGGVFIVPGR